MFCAAIFSSEFLKVLTKQAFLMGFNSVAFSDAFGIPYIRVKWLQLYG